MSRSKEVRSVETEVTVEIICDRCDARVDFYDVMVRQEWIIVGGTGGYGSRDWGDGTSWTADLCERCQHELFAPFAKISV